MCAAGLGKAIEGGQGLLEVSRSFPVSGTPEGLGFLGTNIVRDAESHALFLLECNPRGDAWLMSSDTGRKIEGANGIIFAGQCGALQIAAGVLIRETRRRLGSRIFAQLGSEPVP